MEQKAADTRKRTQASSKDGRWRTFPKVPCLLQYIPSGAYYARVRVSGKLIRRSLDTDVFSTAKLRLPDFLREQREACDPAVAPLFSDALKAYETELDANTAIKPQSRDYRRWCIRKIELSWPELWKLRLSDVSEEACREWAKKLHSEIASHYFNNTIATLRLVFDAGIRLHKRNGGRPLANPAESLTRVPVRQKRLQLPEQSQFRALVENIALRSGGWGPRTSALVQFLAFGGMRAFSEAQHVTWGDIDWTRKEIVVRGSPETGTKNREVRRVPMIPDMEKLLAELASELGGKPPADKRVVEAGKCQGALDRACKELGVVRITHHDLRHLFATRCIEAGVDIPTVARWLGHKDGGALAMRTYGHLRNEHSQEMAKKVRF